MKEYTITFTAEVTKVIKLETENVEEFLVNDVPGFIEKDLARKLDVDDVNVKDYNVKVRDYKVFVGDEVNPTSTEEV